MNFHTDFAALTGRAPFPWQANLYARLRAGEIPSACDVPTGLGKTAVIAIWLLALGHTAGEGRAHLLPRRLAYVVNRRTVVDQATRECEALREALLGSNRLDHLSTALRELAVRPDAAPFGISTLRGQFADNAEWRDDPARASVVVGTVDMIGSRLLFSAYGRGFRTRPAHAGFLGQDALLVHDEAHLEPAFQQLVTSVRTEQLRAGDARPLSVLALTATTRDSDANTLRLSDADRADPVVRKRIYANKGVRLHPTPEDDIAGAVLEFALGHRDSGNAILIFLRRLVDVETVASGLAKDDLAVQRLTGTMRGLERDELAVHDPIFARFLPDRSASPRPGTVYLVCTSAGEVGVNISADHLVCDLTPFDSLAQRFGRVNRFGDGDAQLDIVYPADLDVADAASSDEQDGADASAYDRACAATLPLLRALPQRADGRLDASPAALAGLDADARRAAFTPPPVVPPVSDFLFDVWALTSVLQPLPARPPVTDWLHGIAMWDPPETQVAWREEVGRIDASLLAQHPAAELLEDYPLKPHELLRDQSDRVHKQLKKLAGRHAGRPAWLLRRDGVWDTSLTLQDLATSPTTDLSGTTVLLPPDVGGLACGMLDGAAAADPSMTLDVADRWLDDQGLPRRARVWDGDDPPAGMRLVRSIPIWPSEGEIAHENTDDPTPQLWLWYVLPRSADDDGSRTAVLPQLLSDHLASAEGFARRLVDRLAIGEPEASALILAARWHDVGKGRAVWQRSIGNRDFPNRVLAKSGRGMRPMELTAFRHELGSLVDAVTDSAFTSLPAHACDLALHAVASHHGRARPHFPLDEAFDPERAGTVVAAVVADVPRRYARLQRRYGRWGLAFLESIVRAADALASQSWVEEQR